MKRRTPEEWAEFLDCWIAQDKETGWWAHKVKPQIYNDRWGEDADNAVVLEISEELVDYSGDWGDSLAAPPGPPFQDGELVVYKAGAFAGLFDLWKSEYNVEDFRRPTDEEIKKLLPNRSIV